MLIAQTEKGKEIILFIQELGLKPRLSSQWSLLEDLLEGFF